MTIKSNTTFTVFLTLLIGSFSHMANSIEEPVYEVVMETGDVEIRRYEPTIQAVTVLPGKSSSSEGFKRLAGFIFGGNEREQSIAMTAPVQETLGEDTPTMAFTLPAQYSMEELPVPSDSQVTLQAVPARTLAVVTFSGWATTSKVARYERQLRETLKLDAIETLGNSSLNQYNPPWTLPFLRRNEIMIEVSGAF